MKAISIETQKKVFFSFYCATLCVRAVFAVARCPSVSPSVRHVRVLYPDGSSNFFLSPVAHHSSFFHPERREPPQRGGLNTRGGGNLQCSTFSSAELLVSQGYDDVKP